MKLKLCCWMLWLLTPLVSANALCPAPLRIGYDNWPPYHYYLESAAGKKELQGFAIEALNAMLKRLDCKASYVEMPWKRVLHGLELGVVDIAMEAYFNEDRARYAWFSDAYNPGRSVLWIRKSDAYADTDLASWLANGHTLGITKDYYYGAEISELLRRYAAQVSVVNDEQNYGKLVLGRIDGFLGDVLATPWGLKKEGLSDLIVPHAMAVYEAPTFFMFSKKRLSPEFVREFNRDLAKFKATNEYDIIWRRYAPAG
ncbi:TPA: amino acid ABC transporter substrate-binding protein [Aeromonas dhakensis]|nr:amino acid ABC transporter substrate-binding protein [Aeromonas dhakensis]